MSTISNNIIDELLNLSKNIMNLYVKLSDTEFRYGKESEEYKKIVEAIDLSVEYEEELKEVITSEENEQLLLEFFSAVKEEADSRNMGIMENDSTLFLPILKAETSREFDKIYAAGFRVFPKKAYMKREYESKVMPGNVKSYLTLLEQKKYVELLDEEIVKSNRLDDKYSLIKEKNAIICRNPSIESWYFNGFRRTESLLDDDESIASMIGIPVYKFREAKEDYFTGLVREMENITFNASSLDEEEYRMLELNILLALQNIDPSSVNNLYCEFYKTCLEGQISQDDERYIFINRVYGRYRDMNDKQVKEKKKINKDFK